MTEQGGSILIERSLRRPFRPPRLPLPNPPNTSRTDSKRLRRQICCCERPQHYLQKDSPPIASLELGWRGIWPEPSSSRRFSSCYILIVQLICADETDATDTTSDGNATSRSP